MLILERLSGDPVIVAASMGSTHLFYSVMYCWRRPRGLWPHSEDCALVHMTCGWLVSRKLQRGDRVNHTSDVIADAA